MRSKGVVLAIAVGVACAGRLQAEGSEQATVGTAVVVDGGCTQCQHRHHHHGDGLGDKMRRTARHFRREYRENHRWPEPYNSMARESTQSILDAQVTKGWASATTLYEHHFDPQSNELTAAGRKHVKYIMRHVPVRRRFLYVQAADEDSDTQSRVAIVRELAGSIASTKQATPSVEVVDTLPQSARAVELHQIREQYISSIPAPRLPANVGSSGATSGASASGGQ